MGAGFAVGFVVLPEPLIPLLGRVAPGRQGRECRLEEGGAGEQHCLATQPATQSSRCSATAARTWAVGYAGRCPCTRGTSGREASTGSSWSPRESSSW